MKLGDLVRYDSTRYDVVHAHALQPGLAIKFYTKASHTQGHPDHQMVDVLFSYGVVGDDVYEFEIVNEAR